MGTGIRRTFVLLAIVALSLTSLGATECGNVIIVSRGESIQDAVDAAQPGDTILVKPGNYQAPAGADAVVDIQKSGITLIGNPNAVINATGVDYGVRVGSRSGGCQDGRIQGFRIEGFTIENADNSGVLVANVNNYAMVGGRYLNNAEYGPYPVCSTNGVVAQNYASGHDDAAVYIGQSAGGIVEFNIVEDSTIGIEVENSQEITVRKNQTRDNTAGIFVVVLPGLQIPFGENIIVEENIVHDNNRPNPVAGGNLALLPVGSGILNIGADNVLIRRNEVARNDSFGVASVGNPFFLLDPRIEPFVDGQEVSNNVILDNGNFPDPDRALTPGADIVFAADVLFPPSFPFPPFPDPDPFDNCFDSNVYKTEYVEAAFFPDLTVGDLPCP